MAHQISYLKKAKKIQKIVSMYYEPGRQDRNLRSIHRKYVEPEFGICYKSFLKARYVDTSALEEPSKDRYGADR